MNILELKNWALEHDIEDRTRASLFKMLENYKIDNPDEYKEVFSEIGLDGLTLQVHTVSLNLSNWPECNYNTVSAAMRVYYNKKQIINYKVLYLLSGEAEDDFVEFL